MLCTQDNNTHTHTHPSNNNFLAHHTQTPGKRHFPRWQLCCLHAQAKRELTKLIVSTLPIYLCCWLTGIQMALIYVLVKTWFSKMTSRPKRSRKKWLFICVSMFYVPMFLVHPCNTKINTLNFKTWNEREKEKKLKVKGSQRWYFLVLCRLSCVCELDCASYATKRRCSWVTLQILCQPAGNQPTWDLGNCVCIWAGLAACLLDSFAYFLFSILMLHCMESQQILKNTQKRREGNKLNVNIAKRTHTHNGHIATTTNPSNIENNDTLKRI